MLNIATYKSTLLRIVVFTLFLATTLGVHSLTSSAIGDCSTTPSEFGSLTFSLEPNSSENKEYFVWARMKDAQGTPSVAVNATSEQGQLCDTGSSESVQLNGTPHTWDWARTDKTVTWGEGQIDVKVAGNKHDVGLDCVVLSPDTNFSPSTAEDCEGQELSEVEPLNISIINYSEGDTVSGVVQFQVETNGGYRIQNTAFLVDDEQLGADNDAPYSYTWDTATVENGLHSIMVQATDISGGSQQTTINLNVNNQASNGPPQKVEGLTGRTLSSSSVSLSWLVTVDSDGDNLIYLVERQSGNGSFSQIGTTTTNYFQDDGLSVNTTYSYRVIAQESNTKDRLTSTPSSPVQITTPAECRRVLFSEIDTATSSYINGEFLASSNIFDSNEDQALDFIEITNAISAYINGRCLN